MRPHPRVCWSAATLGKEILLCASAGVCTRYERRTLNQFQPVRGGCRVPKPPPMAENDPVASTGRSRDVAQTGVNGSRFPSELARKAAQHDLTKVGERPPLTQYVKTLWARRAFLWAMSSAKS